MLISFLFFLLVFLHSCNSTSRVPFFLELVGRFLESYLRKAITYKSMSNNNNRKNDALLTEIKRLSHNRINHGN